MYDRPHSSSIIDASSNKISSSEIDTSSLLGVDTIVCIVGVGSYIGFWERETFSRNARVEFSQRLFFFSLKSPHLHFK